MVHRNTQSGGTESDETVAESWDFIEIGFCMGDCVCAEFTRKPSFGLKLSYMFHCLNIGKIRGTLSTEVTLLDHQRHSSPAEERPCINPGYLETFIKARCCSSCKSSRVRLALASPRLLTCQSLNCPGVRLPVTLSPKKHTSSHL